MRLHLLGCPPALGLVTLNACANVRYIPLEAQLHTTDGLTKVLDLLARVQRRLNPTLAVKGIFFTRHDKRKIPRRKTAEELRTQSRT